MKFTNEVFEDFTDGAEFYRHKGSLWLIFTDQKQWVFELSKEGVLWYNYYFFDKIFKFFSMDLIENQKFITEWVEDTIQNGVKHTARAPNSALARVEYTIQNGVKHTDACQIGTSTSIEDTIQNGVKDTHKLKLTPLEAIEDAIQNEVKETVPQLLAERIPIEDTIQNGVKQTHLGGKDRKIDEIKEIIENGLKETTPGGYLGSVEMKGTMVHQFESPKQNNELEDTIQNGVKETNPHFLEILNSINFEPVIKEMKRMNEVHIVLENGIKEVKELPDKSGELKGYGEYYQSQEDRTKPHTQYVNDVLKDGINETNWRCVDNHPTFVDNVLTSGIKEIWGYAQQPKIRVDEVIQSGAQEDLS